MNRCGDLVQIARLMQEIQKKFGTEAVHMHLSTNGDAVSLQAFLWEVYGGPLPHVFMNKLSCTNITYNGGSAIAGHCPVSVDGVEYVALEVFHMTKLPDTEAQSLKAELLLCNGKIEPLEVPPASSRSSTDEDIPF